MEYSVKQLAQLAGVSTRTLRYYDQIGLLVPGRDGSNDYRVYGAAQVDLLQQILFYRALGVDLETIRALVYAPDFDRRNALQSHLIALQQQKAQLQTLIDTVSKTLRSLKGEIMMHDTEKFEGLKQRLVEENEAAFGAEIRRAYGDEAVDASNRKLTGMTRAQWDAQQALEAQIVQQLGEAMKTGDPAGAAARQLCQLHRQWLCAYWKDGAYTKQAHRNMAQMYVSDARFTAYYEEKAGPGAAQFLKDALDDYTR